MLNCVTERLLTSQHIRAGDLSNFLSQCFERRLDYADLYFQSRCYESWGLEDSIIKEGVWRISQGVGVRAVSGEKTGFAYADNIDAQAVQQSIFAARNIVNTHGGGKVRTFTQIDAPKRYCAEDPIKSMTREEKIALLHRIDKVARDEDKRVQTVNASLSCSQEWMLVAATDGTLAADIRPLIHLGIQVQVEQDGRREQGSCGGGGRIGADFFLLMENGEIRADNWAREAVRMALVNLSAKPAPAGAFPVVLGPGWPGVLLHEAVGHGLEGDFNRRETSVFTGKIGEQVASPLCTVVDDGTLAGLRGSLSVDDEGVPGQYNILIEKGILKKYLQDKLNARLMQMSPTGNARRESYACLPMPRMTNTYMLAGESKPDDIIKSVDYGFYAPHFGGGQVDITSGKFVFSMSEAYLIEKGKITTPVKGATLIGSGIEIMQGISMVGNDLALDKGIGTCGKEGQSVPVGVGQPTLKIEKMTVGGTH